MWDDFVKKNCALMQLQDIYSLFCVYNHVEVRLRNCKLVPIGSGVLLMACLFFPEAVFSKGEKKMKYYYNNLDGKNSFHEMRISLV